MIDRSTGGWGVSSSSSLVGLDATATSEPDVRISIAHRGPCQRACLHLQVDGRPALRLVTGTRLEGIYGLLSPGVAAAAGNGTLTAGQEGGGSRDGGSGNGSGWSPPSLASLLLSSPGSSSAAGGGSSRGRRGNTAEQQQQQASIRSSSSSSSSRHRQRPWRRPMRATADVFVPVPTPDPAAAARKAVAGGATLEGVGSTDDRRKQHILVRPPGGALVLVLTSSSSRSPSPPPPPPLPAKKKKEEEAMATSPPPAAAEAEGRQREEGTRFPTLRIKHLCCHDPGEVSANTPQPIPYVNLCVLVCVLGGCPCVAVVGVEHSVRAFVDGDDCVLCRFAGSKPCVCLSSLVVVLHRSLSPSHPKPSHTQLLI